MTIEEYVNNLSEEKKSKLILTMAERLIELEEISFTPGESDDYQGTFTVNAQFYWTGSGDNLEET